MIGKAKAECPKPPAECRPHISHDEAKAKANGKPAPKPKGKGGGKGGAPAKAEPTTKPKGAAATVFLRTPPSLIFSGPLNSHYVPAGSVARE